MVSFGYPKHKQKTLKFAWQHFGTQSSLWIKINLDPTIKWRWLDKINVHTLYNLQFFNGHRALCLWFMKHYQTKENWKNNAMSIYKSPIFIYGNGFSPKKNILLCIYCSKMQKTHFLNEILSKNFKYPNSFRFNLCLSILDTIKKFIQEFHSQPYFWNIYTIFSNSMTSIILSQIYSIHSSFHCLLNFLNNRLD
jgi:hypothetical protein